MVQPLWFVLSGALLIFMTIVSATLKRLPLTSAILYLFIGILLGSSLVSLLQIDPFRDTSYIRLLAEITVIISLFTAGLKLRLPITSPEWKTPILLATVSMLISISAIALAAGYIFHFSIGASILLGAILAPTDPVLASSVQVLGPEDRDRVRFSLTAEAGLNDGTTLPFVLLGLHLLSSDGHRDWLTGWIVEDLLWGSIGGLGLGTALGAGVGWLVGYLRKRHEETRSLDDFLALGLIAFSYGTAVFLHANGFLAVFGAGLALRRRERRESQSLRPWTQTDESRLRTDTVSGLMARGLLEFNEQMERVAELLVVILLGVLISSLRLDVKYFGLAFFLLLFVRPISVWPVRPGGVNLYKVLLAWFGIRGAGSLFYLTLAIEHGMERQLAEAFVAITLSVILLSIVIHGLSAAPMMKWLKNKSGAMK